MRDFTEIKLSATLLGVTFVGGVEAEPVPNELVAVTVHAYAVALTRPVTVIGELVALADTVVFPPLHVAV